LQWQLYHDAFFRMQQPDKIICAGLNSNPTAGRAPRDVFNGIATWSESAWKPCWTQMACPVQMKGTCSWKGKGLRCGLERDTQRQTHEWLPPASTVLEVGSRFGTVSFTISTVQNNSGQRLSIEPDAKAILQLNRNIKKNGCRGIQVNGVVSHSRAVLPTGGYGIMAKSSTDGNIPNYSPKQLEKLLSESTGKPMTFDTLYIDCEGCGFEFILEWPELMKQVKMVFLEADIAAYHRYQREFIPRLCAYGLDVVEDELNHTCCWTIHHVVFARTGRCAAAFHRCPKQPKWGPVPTPNLTCIKSDGVPWAGCPRPRRWWR